MLDTTYTYPRVLTIAGSDSSGGAGIQADLKTFAALGCYGMSAITALTVQNTTGVRAIHAVPLEIIKGQIDAVVDDIGVDAVKIGMLHSKEVIGVVAQAIDEKSLPHVVLDPVMVSAAGSKLIDEQAIGSLVSDLFPKAQVVTPNLDEAGLLLGCVIGTTTELVSAARALLGKGANAVLLKGGHLQGHDVVDVLAVRTRSTGAVELHELLSPRIQTHNLHGAGCTLSSAIAAYLALGLDLPAAVQAARVYVLAALEAARSVCIGAGVGPLNHSHAPLAMRIQGKTR